MAAGDITTAFLIKEFEIGCSATGLQQAEDFLNLHCWEDNGNGSIASMEMTSRLGNTYLTVTCAGPSATGSGWALAAATGQSSGAPFKLGVFEILHDGEGTAKAEAWMNSFVITDTQTVQYLWSDTYVHARGVYLIILIQLELSGSTTPNPFRVDMVMGGGDAAINAMMDKFHTASTTYTVCYYGGDGLSQFSTDTFTGTVIVAYKENKGPPLVALIF